MNKYLFCSLLVSSCLHAALPNGMEKLEVLNGRIETNQSKDAFVISTKQKNTILQWDEFSIEKGKKVTFSQPSKDSCVLNKVVGNCRSNIRGHLVSNGGVYLTNKNGILIGKNGVIDVQSFLATTLNISADDFLSEDALTLTADTNIRPAKLQNLGKILAEKDIYLFAKNIENDGSIKSKSGDVNLTACEILIMNTTDQKVYIHPIGQGKVSNTGQIAGRLVELIGKTDNPYTLAVSNKGVIDGTTISREDGKVVLKAINGKTSVSGKINSANIEVLGEEVCVESGAILDASQKAKAGTICIGGDCNKKNPRLRKATKTTLEADSYLIANGLGKGDGGKVSVWANEELLFYGNISAEGGEISGNGGACEISCPKNLDYKGLVSSMAVNGMIGALVIDPSDIYIDDYSGVSTPPYPTTAPGTYDPSTAAGYLDVGVLQSSLAFNNVLVTTADGTGGSGLITVNKSITWSAPTTLSLHADCAIRIQPGVTITSTGVGNFTAMDFQANQSLTPLVGNFNGIYLNNSTLSSLEGDISLIAVGGNVSHNVGINISSGSILSTGTGSNAAQIILNGVGGNSSSYVCGVSLTRANLQTTDGVIVITGSSDSTDYYNHGINISSNSLLESLGTGNIVIYGTSGSSIAANNGINLGQLAKLRTLNGNIILTGVSTGSGDYNTGIYATESVTIRSTGSGQIQLDGTSGTGNNENNGIEFNSSCLISSETGDIALTAVSNGIGNYCTGIKLGSYTTLESKGTGGSAALITIDTQSGTGQSECHGMKISEGSYLTTIDGDIDATATSRGTGNYCHGIYVTNYSFLTSTGTGSNAGDVTLTTQGGAGSTETIGVKADEGSDVSTVDGTLTVTDGMIIDTP